MATVKYYPKRMDGTKEQPILLKFTIDRNNRFALSTGERIIPKYWDRARQEAKSSYNGHVELNQALGKIKADLIQLYRDNKSAGIDALQEMARPLVKFGQLQAPEKKSLYPIFIQFTDQYQRDKDAKTVAKYHALYRRKEEDGKVIESGKLFEFDKNLTIDSLDMNFYDRFKNFLYDLGLIDSTVFKYLTNLSTFLTWACARGHEIHHTNGQPTHKSWEIIKRRNEPITLTLAELERIEALTFNPEDLQERKTPKRKKWAVTWGMRRAQGLTAARDVLVLACRTGQRISDLLRFDLKDAVDMKWTFFQKKGNRISTRKVHLPFNTPFTAPAWKILEKYNFKIPDVAEKTLNENIKIVCQKAGIDQEITVRQWKQNQQIVTTGPKHDFITIHTGRKTFITIGLQYMAPKLVKDLAGIESWETLKHYEGQADGDVIERGLNSIPSTAIMKVG